MNTVIVLACLYGPCVIHNNVMHIPIPAMHPGKSEAVYTREYGDGTVIVYVPAREQI